jgi:hypothetical protein
VNPEPPKKKHRSERKRWFLLILVFAFVIALSVGVSIAESRAEHRRKRAEIQRRLDTIRANDQPLTAKDLAKLYPDPPPELDASALLKPALAVLSIPDDSANLLFFGLALPRAHPLDQSAMAEGQIWLERNQAAFALISWNKLKHAWVGSGFTNGLTNLAQAPLSKMNCLVRLLCLNAVLEAELQHPHQAVESLQRAAIIGNTFKNDLPIHFLGRATAQSLVSVALERIINRASPDGADLASLPNFMTLTNIGATKESVIFNECPLALLAASLSRGIYEGVFFDHDQDLLNYLDWNAQCRAALDIPMSKAIPALRNIEALQLNAVKNRHNFWAAFEKNRPSLLTLEEPQITAFLLPELTAVAHVRLAVTAVCVERWRSAHGGEVPESLDELAPKFLRVLPLDPFDGQPLRYQKLAKGYALYSPGENLTNDARSNAESGGQDLTFTVEQ